MEYTDRYQRKFHRLLSKKTVLYTEMVTANALHNAPNPERFLEADLVDEEPVVLQLGGSDPQLLRGAAQKAINYGYKDINLNVGCPSERVSDKGCFGAVLMLQPELVGECCLRMEEVMDRKPTVKCRIGVDDRDSYEDLVNFVSTVERIAGTTHFIVHARKAVLGGKFSPAENRSIPPLRYEVVYRLKREFPHLKITLNGGVLSMEEARAHLMGGKVDGVMVGRAAVGQPFEWRTVDTQLYGEAQDPSLSRRALLQRYGEFLDHEYRLAGDAREQMRILRFGLKPVLNLFHGEANSRLYRQQLTSDLAQLKKQPPSPSAILARACSVFRDEALDAA